MGLSHHMKALENGPATSTRPGIWLIGFKYRVLGHDSSKRYKILQATVAEVIAAISGT
jgi:hypothetical protein